MNVASIEETSSEPSSECNIVDGDSMSNISQKIGVPLDDLKNQNPQVEGPGFVVRKGDVLTIPYKITDKLFGVQVI
jgi:LysM repeat protein